tara:strand:+ start:88 stop:279 length:192 start_codon:yes stop_codon:yes gene_type:complete
MKYKLKSGLKLQYGHTKTPNWICRKLLKGEEVELTKEELTELESLGVKFESIGKKKPSKKEEK